MDERDRQIHELSKHIKRGRIVQVKEYLEKGGTPNLSYVLRHGFTNSSLLMVAANFGRPSFINLFLDYGADIDFVDVIGRSALVIAAINGHRNCVELLLERGASVRVRPQIYSFSSEPLLRYIGLNRLKYPESVYLKIVNLLVNAGAE